MNKKLDKNLTSETIKIPPVSFDAFNDKNNLFNITDTDKSDWSNFGLGYQNNDSDRKDANIPIITVEGVNNNEKNRSSNSKKKKKRKSQSDEAFKKDTGTEGTFKKIDGIENNDQNTQKSFDEITNNDKNNFFNITDTDKSDWSNFGLGYQNNDSDEKDADLHKILVKAISENEKNRSPSPKKKPKKQSVVTYKKDTETKNVSNGISHSELAKLIINENIIINLNNVLYYWNGVENRYIPLLGDVSDKFIRLRTPDKYKSRINKYAIEEILQWIKTDEGLDVDKKALKKHGYIAFKNGIYDIRKDKLLPHNHRYLILNVLNANYFDLIVYSRNGEHFERFMSDITNNNDNLYKRLQELFGYVISDIREVKYIPFLVGVKDTGKSIILKILEHIVGEEACTNLSFEQLNKQEFLADLFGKKLNTCGELGELKLNRLDTFKKLSGGDMVSAKALYRSPIYFQNTAALLFAGNHLPHLNGLDKANAFNERLVIFPFFNQIPKRNQDIRLFEKLKDESDYIASWAIEGLKRWIKNNYEFTSFEGLNELKQRYAEQMNSIENFIKEMLEYDISARIHKSEIDEAYRRYCDEKSLTPETTKKLHDHLKLDIRLKMSRFRKDGENRHGYIGIRFKK